jgi:hypothetical protein
VASFVEEQDRRRSLGDLEALIVETHARLDDVLRPRDTLDRDAELVLEPNPTTRSPDISVGGDAELTSPPSVEPADAVTTHGVHETRSEASRPSAVGGAGAAPTTETADEDAAPVAGRAGSAAEGGEQELLWKLVGDDDLPAAYWLSRALQPNADIPAPWLLAAAQGSRWVSQDSDAFVPDLLEITQSHELGNDASSELLALAAALHASLLVPRSGLAAWLKAPRCCPSTRSIVGAIQRFTNRGRALYPEDLEGAAGTQRVKESVAGAVLAAKRWLENASSQRMKLVRATDVWRHLVGPRGDLSTLLQLVAEDRRSDVKKVREGIRQWIDRAHVMKRITDVDRDLVKTKMKEITGEARDQIIRGAAEASEIARGWCDLVERARSPEAQGGWVSDQVQQLRNEVQAALPEACEALVELAADGNPPSMSAGARCLHRSLDLLATALHLTLPHRIEGVQDRWSWFPWNVDTLETALSRRLLWLPDLKVDTNGMPAPESTTKIPSVLRDALSRARALEQAFDMWLDRQDYRFVEVLLRGLGNPPIAQQRFELAVERSRMGLRRERSDTLSAIEQAVVDGILDEERRADYGARVEAIVPEETLDFPRGLNNLTSIREQIGDARRRRLEELQTEWGRLSSRLAGDSNQGSKRAPLEAFVGQAFAREDSRVIEEVLARVNEALDKGTDWQPSWFATDERAQDVLSAYVSAVPITMRWLTETPLAEVPKAIKSGRNKGNIDFNRVPAPRRDEAIRAIDAWRRLKQRDTAGKDTRPILAVQVQRVLGFLGFNFTADSGPQVEINQTGPDWLHMKATMSAGGLSPVPQFGSQVHGSYDIICLWERPSIDTVGSWLRDLRLEPHGVIALYLGQMNLNRRSVVARAARERELALLVLDETLLLFLAGERDARLSAFFACTLPFAAINPYTPFQAGNVPPEMFVGREAMARELQRPDGSCLVYGGRQLGKSALLRHVAREFHNPSRERYAWLEDIKLIGGPLADQPAEVIWARLREGLKAHGLLSPKVTTDKAEEIARHVRDTVIGSSERRVVVLLDEADNFLDADAKNNFRIVETLRALMSDTQRRFKVVFAGLHNVQRFQGIPNQPLAHFGEPIQVGPLEPDAAQRLVRTPFEVLGYRFVDDASVLRILSYTNYHPGLIQLFCQELLKRLHGRPESNPPYRVSQDDVEAVYRVEDVRRSIRERFDWTLALDSRYQAIALAMIIDQMDMRDGYSRAYPSRDLLRMAAEWWTKGFEDVGDDQMRGFLDEMAGLGVLVRSADGSYRLRSPNLVRLMGTEAELESRLVELAAKQPPVRFDADNHHRPLDSDGHRFSPFTHAQERSLNTPKFGVGLLFVSKALGLSTARDAFERFLPAGLLSSGRARYDAIPPDVLTENAVGRWLEEHLAQHSGAERMVVSAAVSGSTESLADNVSAALEVCRRHERSQQRWLRAFFLFEPPSAWRWLVQPQPARTALENRAHVVTWPRRWNFTGVAQRLARHTEFYSDDICQLVLSATDGWPHLLDIYFDRLAAVAPARRPDDPRPVAAAMAGELSAASELRAEFEAALGLNDAEIPRRILQFVSDYGDIPREMVTPEFVEAPDLSIEECQSALEYLLRFQLVSDAEGVFRVAPKVFLPTPK